MVRGLIALVVMAIFTCPTGAETIVLDFGDQPSRPCNSEWEMSGLNLRMIRLVNECAAIDTRYGWVLGNTCLEIDLSPLGGVRNVSASFLNYSADFGFAVYLLDPEVPVAGAITYTTGVREEMLISAGLNAVNRARVFCYNGFLYAITIEYETVGAEGTTWGNIKALYR